MALQDNKNTFTPLLVVLLVVAAFFIGKQTQTIQSLQDPKAKTLGAETAGTPDQAAVQPQPTQVPVTAAQIKALFTDKNIAIGDKNSKNLFVEIADPSCPWCHVAAGQNPELAKQSGHALVSDGGTYVPPVPEMKKLVESGKAAFVWLYTPGHGSGEMGTKALYCGYDQGKFWEVHDVLMTNTGYDLLNNTVKNDKTKSQELVDFLSSAPIDPVALKECLDSGKYDTKLAEDTATAGKLGVSATPGFFINTTPFAGAYSWNDMKSTVKE